MVVDQVIYTQERIADRELKTLEILVDDINNVLYLNAINILTIVFE